MQPHKIIFRDDDIAFAHTAHSGELQMKNDFLFNKFIEIDKLFIKYNVPHTIAVIVKDIEKAVELVEYIKKNKHIDVQLHCFTHEDFTTLNHFDITKQLMYGKDNLESIFQKEITTFFPPFNKVNPEIIDVALKLGLKTSFQKMSLSNYLRGWTKDVINFHYWADECIDLEPALIKYTNENSHNNR